MATNNVTLTREILSKLDNTVLDAIFNAQLADLIERRAVKDAKLFTYCFIETAPEDDTAIDWVLHFTAYAGAAFQAYHTRRAKGLIVGSAGQIVPAAQPSVE